MRLVFAGTPEFAAQELQALIDAGHDIALVLTQPDRPAGRGLKPSPSAVKRFALARGIPVEQPQTLKTEVSRHSLRICGARAMIVAAYGLILPSEVLKIFPHGCINIHASLLPRWRGAAPIQRAILAGDNQTGISIMQMDAGLDTGPVLLQRVTPIAADDTAGRLHDRLAELGGRAIVEALADLERGPLTAMLQEERLATYAAKIEKSEAKIDWSRDAGAIDRQIRAFDPFPGASTAIEGVAHKFWHAEIHGSSGEAGTVLSAGPEGVVVGCGEGSVRITQLQASGGKRMSAEAYLRGRSLPVGTRLGD
jgi:methionyl-tRNA formyltransferase